MTFTYEIVAYSRDPVNRYNHYDHVRTNDPKVAYAFDGNVPLLFKGSSQERVATIHSCNYQTLQEIITYAKFSIPNEDASEKLHFLFGDNTLGGNSLAHSGGKHWYYTRGDRRFCLPTIDHPNLLYIHAAPCCGPLHAL
ncbi:uncharacterized protein A4U43_C01F16890 [Asparagus officinalis]|uniref:Uncharacterized protein n=1 Tax=Asparagus officinalis TaxID=4686 RepID=A0A5P1FSF7_ASPOF|nr:uncharacterized protein A4U43_C01F16890 [Asparagus officinalis]